jgi:hypothetical protein
MYVKPWLVSHSRLENSNGQKPSKKDILLIRKDDKEQRARHPQSSSFLNPQQLWTCYHQPEAKNLLSTYLLEIEQ